MSDDTELVRRMAALAHLDVTDREAEDLGRQFADILAAFETLTRAELEGGDRDPEPGPAGDHNSERRPAGDHNSERRPAGDHNPERRPAGDHNPERRPAGDHNPERRPTGAPLRPDVERPSLAREDALANAPETADGFFSVPKTIGGTH